MNTFQTFAFICTEGGYYCETLPVSLVSPFMFIPMAAAVAAYAAYGLRERGLVLTAAPFALMLAGLLAYLRLEPAVGFDRFALVLQVVLFPLLAAASYVLFRSFLRSKRRPFGWRYMLPGITAASLSVAVASALLLAAA